MSRDLFEAEKAELFNEFNEMIVSWHSHATSTLFALNIMLNTRKKGLETSSRILERHRKVLDARVVLFIEEWKSLTKKEVEQFQLLKQTYIQLQALEKEYLDLIGITK